MERISLRIAVGGGVDLAADAFGRRGDPAVVLLHGTGQTRDAWSSTAEVLARAGWYAVTVDLRGHGDSGWSPDGLYETDRLANDVVAVVETVGRPAALVGASLGGRSALIAAGEAVEPLASALVLVETAARLADGGAARIGTFLREHLDGFDDLDQVADAIARYRQTPRRATDEERLLQVVRRRADGRYHWHWDARLVVRDGEIVQHRAPTEQERNVRAARALTVPTLLVRGEHSDLVTRDAARHLLDLVPHARLVEVAEAGHNERFQAAVLDFLTEHRPD